MAQARLPCRGGKDGVGKFDIGAVAGAHAGEVASGKAGIELFDELGVGVRVVCHFWLPDLVGRCKIIIKFISDKFAYLVVFSTSSLSE